MRKGIIYILTTCLFCLNLSAQSNVLNETYDTGDSLYNGADYILELNSLDEFLMQIQYTSFGGANIVGSKFLKINKYGQTIDTQDVKVGSNTLIGTGLLEINTNIYSLHALKDPSENNRFDTYLMKLDKNLDTLYSKRIDIGYNDAGANLTYVSENKLRYLAYYYADSTILENSQVVMVTIDTLGNILDQWEYGGTSYDFAYDYKPTADGGYIIGGSTKDSINDDADLFLLKIGSNGIEEWYNKYGTSNEESVRTWNYIETLADGGSIISGEENHNPINPPYISTKGILLKVDNNGLLIWKKKCIYI